MVERRGAWGGLVRPDQEAGSGRAKVSGRETDWSLPDLRRGFAGTEAVVRRMFGTGSSWVGFEGRIRHDRRTGTTLPECAPSEHTRYGPV